MDSGVPTAHKGPWKVAPSNGIGRLIFPDVQSSLSLSHETDSGPPVLNTFTVTTQNTSCTCAEPTSSPLLLDPSSVHTSLLDAQAPSPLSSGFAFFPCSLCIGYPLFVAPLPCCTHERCKSHSPQHMLPFLGPIPALSPREQQCSIWPAKDTQMPSQLTSTHLY